MTTNIRLRLIVLVIAVSIVLALPGIATAQDPEGMPTEMVNVRITSGGQEYPADLSVPTEFGPYPAIVLLHSFRGMETGYYTMVDQLAAQGFLVLAVHWQNFEQKVYYGEPHGFMLANSALRTDDNALDAFNEMVDFFQRKLG